MNKADIVDKVHGVLGTTKADAERAVETMIDSIVSGLKGGDEVSIAGPDGPWVIAHGGLELGLRAARPGTVPRCGRDAAAAPPPGGRADRARPPVASRKL